MSVSSESAVVRPRRRLTLRAASSYLQALPLTLILGFFLLIPLLLLVAVSFWDYDFAGIYPDVLTTNYADTLGSWVTWKTYLNTLKFAGIVWVITLFVGFWIAYFLAFHIHSAVVQAVLFVVCTVPFWTSNVIRMISWVPLLGRNGLVNQTLQGVGLTDQPVEWLLFSDFSVVLAFVHLYTMFMIVPIFNSMMRIDRSLLEAASDIGASGWQTLWNVIVPLCKTGILIGSIFVVTIVMGDFVTIGVMGGQQIASVGKIIQVQTSYLQFPLAAANAVILLAAVLMIIWGLTRLVDIRREL